MTQEILKPLYDDSYVSIGTLIPKDTKGNILKDYTIQVTSLDNKYVLMSSDKQQIWYETDFIPFVPNTSDFKLTLFKTINEAVEALREYLKV